MSVVVYPAIVTPEGGALQARFVDLPELAVSAELQTDLIRLARERLIEGLQQRERREETWPEPSRMQGLQTPAGASVILVDVSVEDTPVRLTISMGERLLRRIDQDAESRSMTRSGYLALGARRLLGDAAAPGAGLAGDTGQKLQEEMAALGRRVNEAVGPDSPVGKTLAGLDAMALSGLRHLGGEVSAAFKGWPRPKDAERDAEREAGDAEPAPPPAAPSDAPVDGTRPPPSEPQG